GAALGAPARPLPYNREHRVDVCGGAPCRRGRRATSLKPEPYFAVVSFRLPMPLCDRRRGLDATGTVMMEKPQYLLNRLRERLGVKPRLVCILSIGGGLLARRADETELGRHVPDIEVESIGTLLDVMSASMLVIATFAAGSMVSAYASASSTATPRAFPLVVADDVSQNALSTFVNAFIFSIVGLIAVTN